MTVSMRKSPSKCKGYSEQQQSTLSSKSCSEHDLEANSFSYDDYMAVLISSLNEGSELFKLKPYALYCFYFCHGVQKELPGTALYLVLKDCFNIRPADYSFIQCLNWIPWALKPIVGYISDHYPIAGRRRTPYIMIGLLLNFTGWLMLSLCPTASSSSYTPSCQVFMTIMVLKSVASVVSETAVDSLLAELSKSESADQMGCLQSTVVTYDAAGSVVGALLSILALSFDVAHPQKLLFLCAICVAISALGVPFISEKTYTPHRDNKTKSVCPDLKSLFASPVLLKTLALVFVVSCCPTVSNAFTYFQSDVLKFSPAFLSWNTVIYSAANFLAAFMYSKILRTWDMRSVFQNTIICSVILTLINTLVVQRWNLRFGIPDRAMVIGDTLATGITGEIMFMPVPVLAARFAPKGREGTFYAIVMSVLNLAWATSEFFSGLLAHIFHIEDGNYDSLSPFMMVCAATSVVPLLFLRFVPELSSLGFDEEKEKTEKKQDLDLTDHSTIELKSSPSWSSYSQ